VTVAGQNLARLADRQLSALRGAHCRLRQRTIPPRAASWRSPEASIVYDRTKTIVKRHVGRVRVPLHPEAAAFTRL